jgi:transposase
LEQAETQQSCYYRRSNRHVSSLYPGRAQQFVRCQNRFVHFHVIKYFNDKLSDLRRQLYHDTKDKMQSQALKGLRWILLKNPENLDEEKNEKEQLEKALQMNKPLATAYYLKEDLRQLWNKKIKKWLHRI